MVGFSHSRYPPVPIVQALTGLVVFHIGLWLLSEDRTRVKWSIAGAALGLQFALAVISLERDVLKDSLRPSRESTGDDPDNPASPNLSIVSDSKP